MLFCVISKQCTQVDEVGGMRYRRYHGLSSSSRLPALGRREEVEEAFGAIVEESNDRMSFILLVPLSLTEYDKGLRYYIRRPRVTILIKISRKISMKDPNKARYSRLDIPLALESLTVCAISRLAIEGRLPSWRIDWRKHRPYQNSLPMKGTRAIVNGPCLSFRSCSSQSYFRGH